MGSTPIGHPTLLAATAWLKPVAVLFGTTPWS
jgi:hypothetical protein